MADNETNALTNQEVVKQGSAELRRTVQHLPAFYRTDANQRFLSATLDPLVQKGSLDRLDGFIGRQDAYTRKATDRYISATSRDRLAYQLEPTVTYTKLDTTSLNPEDQVEFSATYDDYINQIKYFGGKVDNHDRINKEKVYSWNPAIDYDKLVNYREYYWLPEGPNAIEIAKVGPGVVAEYKVTNVVKGAYNFSIQDGTNNPILRLYRGNTYKFNIDAEGHPFWIMTEPYKDKIAADGSTSTIYSSGVTNNGSDNGIVTFTVPTNAPDTLYYQCGNHDAMYGSILIKDVETTDKIDPEKDIIGAMNYSVDTLDLSNGMKIKFDSTKVSSTYQNKEYYIEGIGDKITLTDVASLITPGSYSKEFTVGYDSFVFDQQPYSKSFYRPQDHDYITIKRDSRDKNAWSRYNRWFHKSIIEEVGRVNGYTAELKETDRAKSPIIEFDSGLQLYDHGTVAKNHITLIDTVQTDAFSNVVNQPGYIIDGLPLTDGMRVMFTADTDPTVKNKIYEVSFIIGSDSSETIALTPTSDSAPVSNESLFVEFGTDNQGKTFFYDSSSTTWKESQQKSSVNQQPLFAMFDNNHVSFDDATTYPNSSFEGAKVFAFATSETATKDTVLGLKVKYNTINNIGDIVFESDHTSGTFTYKSGTSTLTKNLAEGHLHYTTSLSTHNNKSAWIEREVDSKQRVVRTFIADSNEKQFFQIDFYKESVNISDLEIAVSVNGIYKDLTTDYTIVDGSTNKYVKFNKELDIDDQVKIVGYSSSKKVDEKGIYEIPENLETNAENIQLGTFTFGEVVGHVKDIVERNSDVTGVYPGVSNLRDKPNARLRGGKIKQHQGSLLPAMFGLVDQQANVIKAIEFCNKEYEKFYDAFLTLNTGNAYEGVVVDRVDEILKKINQGKNNSFAFYYDDMIGHGENVSIRTYNVLGSSQTEYALDSQHSISKLSNRAVYVYLNDVQLILGQDYTFSTEDDSLTITTTLAEGDTVIIKDYPDTSGSYIPPTPTKLGMYPKFKPEQYTDNSYQTATSVIRRHDGSIIKSFGDERDDLILELEKRIYNNCKTSYDATLLDFNEVMPSAFTSTDYSLQDITDVMSTDFYIWAGANGVQYITNSTFSEGSPFTYNYSQSKNRLTGENLPGYWRGIYKYVYDTDTPHTTPWEILGHSEKPSDWETTYGAGPYTSGNDLLWNDIAIQTGRYGKPSIKDYLPVDASGNLRDPISIGLVDALDIPGRSISWKFGDHSPAETAWRRSSSYPFTVIKTLALTRPAKFFSVYFDNSRLIKNVSGNLIDSDTGVRQNLAKAKYHLETETNNSTGVVTRYSTSGYQPLVVNHLIARNLDTISFFYDKMKGLKVQLSHKLGGFTDKGNLNVLTDSVSPGSTAGSKFIPDENYKLLFRTSNPVDTYYYSGVLIEKNTDTTLDGSTLAGGYKVLGYSSTNPTFNFYYPIRGNQGQKIRIGEVEVAEYPNYSDTVQTIPYGHVFETIQDVADFLFGYGRYLEKRGFRFNKYSGEIKKVLNWSNAVSEFLFWTTQNWAPGSAVTVSPGASGIELETNNAVVGRLMNLSGDYSILDAGGRKIDIKDISTKRVGTTFDLKIKDPDVGLYNIVMNTVQKEHLLIFDNNTVFNDVIYDTYSGFRQERLKLVGWKTGNWNGDYYAPGFIFDAAKIKYWTRNTDYSIGDTVEYQGRYYVCKINHNSLSEFDNNNWTIKDDKPTAELIPNFDYKISQFNDFYNLETNNFDESQQNLGQRLIGYQSRDYLQNLFENDVSQYKFYQGYIREKGTKAAIDKLLKARYENQDISLDIFPEWMIRSGNFGNTDSVQNIQFVLNKNEIVANPQSIELFDNTTFTKNYVRSLGIAKQNFYHDPVDYNAAITFKKHDYSKEGVNRDNIQKIKTAGYPQINQVQRTVFDIDQLLDIDVSTFQPNDLIWVANKTNKDWDVLKVMHGGVNIESLQAVNNATQMKVIFNDSHGLSAASGTSTADYFAITNAQVVDLNGVYKVQTVVDHKTLLVDFDGVVTSLPSIGDNSTADSYGNLYKFISVRISSMDNVNDRLAYSDYDDKNTALEVKGDKVFADADSSGLWRVYEKQNPYTLAKKLSPDTATTNQDFGFRIVARNDGRTMVASAPTKAQGEVHFLFRSTTAAGTEFQNQSTVSMTENDDTTSQLGFSLSMSSDENFVVAGAPFTNTLGSDGSTRFADSGLIKIYLWDPSTFKYGILNTLTPPTEEASQNFGHDHKIVEPGLSSLRTTPTKYLFVSAPGLTSEQGVVYMYEWGIGADGSTYDTWTQNLTIESNDKGSGKRFGHAIAVNDNGDLLAVSSKAPGKAGTVEIFRRTSQSSDDSVQHSFTFVQSLSGTSADGSSLNTGFGETIEMSKDGTTLIIGAPGADNVAQADAGAIYYYKWDADGDSTLAYTLQQTVNAPDTAKNMRFGSTLDLNDSGNRLLIGAENYGNKRKMLFDNGETTFDLQDTEFVDDNTGSGAVYTATLYNTKYVIDDRLVTESVSSIDDFGRGLCVIDNTVFVGSPNDNGNIDSSDGSSLIEQDGTVSVFDLTTAGKYAWDNITTETPLMDTSKLGQVFDFDVSRNTVRDYYELYDPVKGNIPGLADREIKYKTPWDPAVYNFGDVNDQKTAWDERHVGEVWWDLSRVKYIWYEQDDQEYKSNNWGRFFPGSEIHVYEWIESTRLPSEYIGGTPLHADNSNLTVREKYNSVTDTLIPVYYYWVRNKITIPTEPVVPRKNSVSFVANIISNPIGLGLKYYVPTDDNKLLLANATNLVENNIVLNIDIRENNFEGSSHSVWKLVREGDKDFRPVEQVENRWWDSLIGKNSTGDLVPDPDLPVNERYGNSTRPRQSWYVNRFDALKEIIDYANSVMKKKQLTGTINLSNLNSSDPEPTEASLEWDSTADTYADLTYINTKDLSGTVKYLVKADETANGFWAIYTWDGTEFSRTKLQTYNTSKYWEYTDWYEADGDMTHNENTRIDKQVTYQYELDNLEMEIGQHVKVTQADTGGWKLFMYTANGFKNVGTENGTIRIKTSIYDYSQDATGFAGQDNFDDNFFDQEPSVETRNILRALRDDIFIGERKIEYNTLFFTGLRKVLEEQAYVDWMFKTSFINVKNSVRQLDTRRSYTIGTDDWVESYINEVKPFHTKLREYKLGYTSDDTQDGLFSDFDNPTFYDKDTNKIRSINLNGDVTKLTEYPWKIWNDYYKKHVESITITNSGSGYEVPPTVTILGGTIIATGPFQILGTSSSGSTSGSYGYYYPLFTSELNAKIWDSQNGGSGNAHSHTFVEYAGTFYMPNVSMNHAQSSKSGEYKMYDTPSSQAATAVAKIGSGKVTSIEITSNGRNYNATPTVLITGGKTNGTTPTDSAKAYANLNNDLVRDVDVTMKFDRIKSTHNVVDWAKNTAYAYGQLIRYDSELYKANKAFTSTTKFADSLNSLYKVYGDETGLTAADRTAGFYNPTAGMPGNELSQLMSGVDYGGTMVTGLLFSQEGGWDNSPYYNFPWDNFGESKVKTFFGDGSTTTYTFDSAPAVSDVYTVYFDGTRQVKQVIRGDGSSTVFPVLGDDSSAPGNGVKVELIPFDDDKVLTPTDDRTLDTLVTGGLFASALGTAPSDIITDGDGFVTPDTSYAPEEAVPGQIFETLDFKVYTSPESGVPFISEKNYIADGNTTVFSIGEHPGTLGSVTVAVDGVVQKLNTDFTVQVTDKTITFSSAPSNLSTVSTKVFAISGENYRVLDQFVGDGSTVEFTTSTSGEFNLDSSSSEIYVTVDGVPRTDFNSSITANTVTITFNSPVPDANALIQVAGFNKSATTSRSFASIRTENHAFAGLSRFTLSFPPGSIGPLSGLTIIEVNGKVLRGPDNTYYNGDGSTYTFGVASGLGEDSTVDPAKTITSSSQVEVFVNGVKKQELTDYTVDLGNQNIEFTTTSLPSSSDVIAISTLVDTHYTNDGTDVILDLGQIATDGYTLNPGDTITVTTFNNALGMKLRREVLEGRANGIFNLRFGTLNSSYTFVYLNGVQLVANQDYTLNGNVITVVGKTITTSDRLDVMYFAVDSAVGATGFRIFKDMLNRTFYKRISKTSTTEIAEDMQTGAQTIQVKDGTVLATPDASINMPGVIFVDKERIEYFTKSGDTLGQLRRGTLGTGIKDHRSGAQVVDASGTQTIPYTDIVYTNTFTGADVTSDGELSPLSQTPSSANELDIFIGGQRLLLNSEDGSTVNYSVDGTTAAVTLHIIKPANNTQIKILHKKGQVWYTANDGNPADGKGLQGSTSIQARFIAEEPTNAPE